MEAKPSAKPATSRGEYKQSPNASCACAASSSNDKRCRVSALWRKARADNSDAHAAAHPERRARLAAHAGALHRSRRGARA